MADRSDSVGLPGLLETCQRINAERDPARLAALLAEEATRLLGAERASIFLLDRERGELVSQVALGSDPIRFDARLGIAGAAALGGEPIRAECAPEDARFFSGVDALGGFATRSLLAVPLRDPQGEVIGAFEVLNKRAGAFSAADEAALAGLAAQAAIALETARQLDQLARQRDRLLEENAELLREARQRFGTRSILGLTEPVQAIVRLIDRMRESSVPVLVTGESGTGKERVARAIHFSSARAARPFVALNCAALPDALVESELFGIEKGVATGVERRVGRFEEAHGGTLFLDEIGDLSLAAQAKILRVLQEGTLERVGGRGELAVDVRVIAATNKELEREIARGAFREDLYYRLKVIHVRTPALREIPDDVPVLANHFLARFCREAGRAPLELPAPVLRRLESHRWPGNVRELENEMRRLAVLVRGRAVSLEDLSEAHQGALLEAAAAPAPPDGQTLKDRIEAVERRAIEQALRETGNNQARAARALGLSRQGLIKKIKRYGMGPVAAPALPAG